MSWLWVSASWTRQVHGLKNVWVKKKKKRDSKTKNRGITLNSGKAKAAGGLNEKGINKKKVTNMAPHAARLVYTAGIKTRCHTQIAHRHRDAGAAQKFQRRPPQLPPTVNAFPAMWPDAPHHLSSCGQTLQIAAARHHTKDSPLAECEAQSGARCERLWNLRLTECGSATLGEFFSSCPSSIGAPRDMITHF